MKAIRIHEFGTPEVMQLEDVPSPTPTADEVLIEIKAVGVNPVDTYVRGGKYGAREFPFTPGFDGAGVVLQVGPGVQAFSPGQRVFTACFAGGTYAQQCLCPAAQVYALPKNVSFVQGATLGVPYGTAYRSLFQRAHAAAGKTVFIHGGSGGVGIAAIQLAKAAGLKIVATAGTDAGRQLLRQQGADLALDHHRPEHFDQVLDFTDGQGVDVLLEMLADANLANDLKVMAQKGEVVVIGSRGPVEKLDARDLMSREAIVYGTLLALATKAENEQAYQAIQKGLADGTLNPVIAREMPLSDAAKAHHEIIESAHYGKIVLIP